MILEKAKRSTKALWRKLRLYASFPHMWIAFTIFILVVASFFTSLYLNHKGIGYWSSLFSNISMGLLTGLVLCFISSAKQISVAQLNSKKFFLEQLCAKINDFYQLYHDLVAKPFKQFDDSTELFDFIYDTGSHANWINEYLLQSSFNKVLFFDPLSFCKKKFHYDALALADVYEELRCNLHQIDILCPSKKEIIGYFSTVEKELRQLRTAAYQEIEEIDIRLAALNRSIF